MKTLIALVLLFVALAFIFRPRTRSLPRRYPASYPEPRVTLVKKDREGRGW